MFARSSILRSKKILLFLLIGICSRSLVASGFMLDASPDHVAYLSVEICPGQAGLDVFSGYQQTTGHDQHAHAHGPEKANGAQADHASSCVLWTASGLTMTSDAGSERIGLIKATITPGSFQSPLYRYAFPRSGSAREPPFLS